MAIILTTHDGNIIAWNRTPWMTPGEYSNPVFRVVLCDLLPTERPKAIINFGSAISKTFYTHEGPIICPKDVRAGVLY